MENVLPHYKRPIHFINDPINSVVHWDLATDAFDEKNYKEAVINTINYLNPSILKDKDLKGDINITQMHGSTEVNITITDDSFLVKAPFLKMTNATNKIALQRKVAEVNFHPLTLVQIRQEDNAFMFEYKTDISLCNPYKIYDVLRDVCVYGDDYDDIFIDKYKAAFYKEPQIEHVSIEDNELIWNQITAVFNDYKNYVKYFKEKRWDDYNWDMIVISLLKISNMPYVHGKLRSDLIEYVSILFNGSEDFNIRVNKGFNFMNSLIEKPREEIMKNVYHAAQFQSIRWRSSEKIIAQRLENNREQVENYLNNESYFALSYYLQFTFLRLIYDYNLDQNYKNAIYNALEVASGKEPRSGYKILVDTYFDLLNATIKTTSTKKTKSKKGFFASLFS